MLLPPAPIPIIVLLFVEPDVALLPALTPRNVLLPPVLNLPALSPIATVLVVVVRYCPVSLPTNTL